MPKACGFDNCCQALKGKVIECGVLGGEGVLTFISTLRKFNYQLVDAENLKGEKRFPFKTSQTKDRAIRKKKRVRSNLDRGAGLGKKGSKESIALTKKPDHIYR